MVGVDRYGDVLHGGLVFCFQSSSVGCVFIAGHTAVGELNPRRVTLVVVIYEGDAMVQASLRQHGWTTKAVVVLHRRHLVCAQGVQPQLTHDVVVKGILCRAWNLGSHKHHFSQNKQLAVFFHRFLFLFAKGMQKRNKNKIIDYFFTPPLFFLPIVWRCGSGCR